MAKDCILTKQDLSKVPGRENYSARYLEGGRVFSFAHQIDSALSFEPKSVLEVGLGTGMIAAALRALGIDVLTVDVKHELHPDCVASVLNLPLANQTVDVALCCQVLEHLPFTQFQQALLELGRVVKKGVVLSLPDALPHYEIRLRLPKIRNFYWSGSRRRRIIEQYCKDRWQIDGHYWEIGYDEITLPGVLNIIKASSLYVQRVWRVSEFPYHRFFLLRRPWHTGT